MRFMSGIHFFPVTVEANMSYQGLLMSSHPCPAAVLAVQGGIVLSSGTPLKPYTKRK